MQITLSNSDKLKVAELLKTKNDNMRAADMFLFYLENESDAIDLGAIEKQKLLAKADDEQAYVQLMSKRLGLDARNPQDKDLMTRFLFKAVKKLLPKSYLEDAYYQNIHITPAHMGRWSLAYQPYLPWELFVYDDVLVDTANNYLERSRLGFFTERFDFLAVAENDVTWMSITPNEIETMREPIAQSHGNVLTFGLGLGYFAYMASLKKDVQSVTIVEKNAEIIALFEKSILPQFAFKDKIRIVRADAFDFLEKKMTLGAFDFAFVDLWHGGDDGLFLYLKMKHYEDRFAQTRFAYWLETSLIVMLRRCVLTLLEEEMEGSRDADYQTSETPTDRVVNSLHRLLKTKTINTYQNAVDLVTSENLKALAKKIF